MYGVLHEFSTFWSCWSKKGTSSRGMKVLCRPNCLEKLHEQQSPFQTIVRRFDCYSKSYSPKHLNERFANIVTVNNADIHRSQHRSRPRAALCAFRKWPLACPCVNRHPTSQLRPTAGFTLVHLPPRLILNWISEFKKFIDATIHSRYPSLPTGEFRNLLFLG